MCVCVCTVHAGSYRSPLWLASFFVFFFGLTRGGGQREKENFEVGGGGDSLDRGADHRVPLLSSPLSKKKLSVPGTCAVLELGYIAISSRVVCVCVCVCCVHVCKLSVELNTGLSFVINGG